MERGSLERLLAAGYSLERIGRLVEKHPSTVGYWIKRHGLEAAHREKYAPRGGVPEQSLRHLVEAGCSIPVAAKRFGVSVSTIRYWLDRYGLTTQQAQRTRKHRDARTAGLVEVELLCARHGATSFRKETTGRYRCIRCNSEGVSRRRRRVKEILVREAGGRCVICGYDRYQGALEFHHRDPGKKSFAVGHDGKTRSLTGAREEARKCVLLCANCHAEVEAGVATLPSLEADRLGRGAPQPQT